jgi:hypothetical protein
MKRIWIAVIGLLALLFWIQHVLETRPAQRLERASQNLRELKTSSLLPTYIGSLFLGSFRAVAIDILWIQMQRMREQEHRYFETVEYMELITKLQPRNPEAWAYMAWDCGYNIANQFRTEEDLALAEELEKAIAAGGPRRAQHEAQLEKLRKRIIEKDKKYRIWIRRGLLTLKEACGHMPDDPYLHHDIGQTLWSKSAWSAGILEVQFIQAIEEDVELQKILGEGLPPGRKRTPFELAEAWFAKGQAKLENLIKEGRFRVYRTLMESMSRPPEDERRHHTTQMGRNIDLASFVGAIQQMRYLNGILLWLRARESAPENARALLLEASESFSKAADQAMVYRKTHSLTIPERRAFHDARADLCRGLAALTQDQAGMALPLSEGDRRRLLARLEPIRWNPLDREFTDQIPPPDERYVLDYMGVLKRSIGGDSSEYNDDFFSLHRGNLLDKGDIVDATIGPDAEDVDYYHYYASVPAPNAHRGHSHDAPEPQVAKIVTEFQIQCMDDATLTVTPLTFTPTGLTPQKSFEVSKSGPVKFTVTSEVEGSVFLKVTGTSAAPSRRGYRVTALGARRGP